MMVEAFVRQPRLNPVKTQSAVRSPQVAAVLRTAIVGAPTWGARREFCE